MSEEKLTLKQFKTLMGSFVVIFGLIAVIIAILSTFIKGQGFERLYPMFIIVAFLTLILLLVSESVEEKQKIIIEVKSK